MAADYVPPFLQLLGTVVAATGAVVVAWVANRKELQKPPLSETPASKAEWVNVHADIIELCESMRTLTLLVRDFWQWQRDRDQAWNDRMDNYIGKKE